MKAKALLATTWILTACSADWGAEPFPELADIPDPPERATSIEEKRAIAAEMAEDLAEEAEEAEEKGPEGGEETDQAPE